jgi:hypothetical protein
VRIGCQMLPAGTAETLLDLEYPESDEEAAEATQLRERLETEVEGWKKLERKPFGKLRETDTDNDSERALVCVPFVGVYWCEEFKTAGALAQSTPVLEEEDNLWGNESMFMLRAYAAAAVLIDVIDPASMSEMVTSDDLRSWGNRDDKPPPI